MSETKYTSEQIEALIGSDSFLEKKETEKYAVYKSTDPFPKVGEALLNSVDLLMYLLTVGIVEPFDVNKLKGVTYQCTFSGEAHWFDLKTNRMEETNLDDTKELTLEPNSITYLKIEEKFHVPEYMVLRFNLSVSNAYKGVLLGTGPIVDPGFEGNLFIPLHNLTGNRYIIKRGAPLIRVEFTKLSRHVDWNNKRRNLFPHLKPITKNTPQNARFSKFFEDALLDPDEKKFYTYRGNVSVRSSIPEAISTAQKNADEAQKNAEEAQKNAESAANTADGILKKIRTWSIIGAVGTLIAVTALMFSVYSLIQDANSRYDSIVMDIKDCNQQMEILQEKLEQYEMIKPPSSEQNSGSSTSDEADNSTPSSSSGTGKKSGEP